MRRSISIGTLVLAAMLAASPVRAATPEIELQYPRKATAIRGEPALLEVVLAPDQAWATALHVEVDGEPAGDFLPWKRRTVLELEPGLHRITVVGWDARDGERARSKTIQIAVFHEAQRKPLNARARHAWTAAVAFVVAVGGATMLRRREKL